MKTFLCNTEDIVTDVFLESTNLLFDNAHRDSGLALSWNIFPPPDGRRLGGGGQFSLYPLSLSLPAGRQALPMKEGKQLHR
jgi:hypothetical protein